jgi:hopanoid-associated phosphorylase
MLAALNAAITHQCSGVLSFGIAGGLDPTLRPGVQIVASAVVTERGILATDESWSSSLMHAHPRAIRAPILSVRQPVADPAGKRAHLQRTGGAAVDMESHIAGEIAHKHGLPFAALRVVADPATRRVPQAALCGLRPDGRTDAFAVMRALMRRPGDIAGTVRIARDARIARLALLKSPPRLGVRIQHR